MKKTKILTFVSHYLPGYKAGGPLRTIENMVNHLSDSFDFLIITGDRDLGDETPYPEIEFEKWTVVGKAHVYYIPQNKISIAYYKKLIKNTEYDIVYLNSFFDKSFTAKPLFALKNTNKPILVAPRGEFSPGAIRLKSLKKQIYIKLFSWLYKKVYFQASSQLEKEDILYNLQWVNPNHIYTALDLPQKYSNSFAYETITEAHDLRIIFLSRLSPIKNLDYALNILSNVTKSICFDIYGPIEDKEFWRKCLKIINSLPDNITVRYQGQLIPDQIRMTFAQYDLFLFPTKGENYGHVIAESLSVGTPVLISDQTPWQNLQKQSLGWEYSLNSPEKFVETVEVLASTNINKKKEMRLKTYKNAHKILSASQEVEKNRNMFLQIIASKVSVK